MLWAKKQKQIRAAVEDKVTGFLKTRVAGAASAVDMGVVEGMIHVDMSRSATRLRRRMYAAWGKPAMAFGELLRLTPTGIQPRPLNEDPTTLGDVRVNLPAVTALVRSWSTGRVKLTPRDQIKALKVLLDAVASQSAKAGPWLTETQVALLVALQAQAGENAVAIAQLTQTLNAGLSKLGVPQPQPEALATDVDTLKAAGALEPSADGTTVRVPEHISLEW